MAERRMFTKKITESDAFLDMPMSSQCLYFHLNMSADDDGFINNPRRIMRLIGANEDDLKLLIAKSFVIVFESGVIVIKHWKMHNYIQSDRYKPTDYIEEKSMLGLKQNKAYTLDESKMIKKLDTKCIQDVSVGKDRLGKDRLGNNILSDKQKEQLADNMTPITLEVINYLNEKANTNFKPCTDKTKRCIKARVNEGFVLADFKKVIDKKVNSWMGTEWQKYLRPETLFGTKFEGYLNEVDVKPKGNSFNEMMHTDYDFDEIEKQILK